MVDGLDNLDSETSLLVVGYHGRPVALDLIMLATTMHERFGKPPCPIVHRGIPATLRSSLGWITGDGPALGEAIQLGQHILVTPGGAREGTRGYGARYRVDWGSHTGYLRLALRYGLPVVPVGASGVDDLYLSLGEAYPFARTAGSSLGFAWRGLGPLGFFPFSPPFPVQIRQVVGRAIDLTGLREDPRDFTEAHRSIMAEVQCLVDRARAMA
jgi:hypothetical protein